MSSVLSSLADFLHSKGFGFQAFPDNSALRLSFAAKNGTIAAVARWGPNEESLTTWSVCPVMVPPERRAAMMEFITRCNAELAYVRFTIDLDKGELRCTATTLLTDRKISAHHAEIMVLSPVWAMDQHLPIFMELIYGAIDPAEALRRVKAMHVHGAPGHPSGPQGGPPHTTA